MSAPSFHSKRREDGAVPTWHDIHLSPAARATSWTQPPEAVQLGEDEVSPTNFLNSPARSPFFSFAAKRLSLKKKSMTPKLAASTASYAYKQNITSIRPGLSSSHGSFHSENTKLSKTARHTRITLAVLGILCILYLGTASWNTLLTMSQDPLLAQAPPHTPAAQAQAAFARNFPRDFGAAPSLWVILEASLFGRVGGTDDSHSFTDDTSVVYTQGKEYALGLSEVLERRFNVEEDKSPIKVTSYYSLQEQGLDYVARNMVTPDGAKTMIQIQYLENELQQEGIQSLKEFVLEYAAHHQPSALYLHHTGQNWNPPLQHSGLSGFFVSALFIFSVAAVLMSKLGDFHSVSQTYLVTTASMIITISISAIALSFSCRTTTPLALSALAMISFVLSVYFSTAQTSIASHSKAVRLSILKSGTVLGAVFASLYNSSSPTLKTVSVASTIAVTTCTIFQAFLVPRLLMRCSDGASVARRPNKWTIDKSAAIAESKLHSTKFLLVSALFFFCVAYQIRRLPYLVFDGIAPTSFLTGLTDNRFQKLGDIMGHGRLTPYRVLFDGHKPNMHMVSLGGYDIVQMVVDELTGISIEHDNNSGDAEVNDDPGVGSTHVGEESTEVKHLVQAFMDTLLHFKEEQQREFDFHHQRRQARLKEHHGKHQENSYLMENVRSDFNLNSGVHATSYTGIAVLENSRIPQSLYSAANACRNMEPRCPSESLHLLNVLEDATTTSDKLATYVYVNLGIDPFSDKGVKWLQEARQTIRRLQKDPRILGGVEVYIDGPAAILEDLNSSVHRGIQRQFFLSLAVLMAVLTIVFWNVRVPLQIMASTYLSMSFALGLGSLVYQTGALNWISLSIVSSTRRGMESGGMTAFSETMLCLLIATSVLVSNILPGKLSEPFGTYRPTSALVAMIFGVLELYLSMYKQDGPVQWPLLVSIAIFVDIFWMKNIAIPALSKVFSSLTGVPTHDMQGENVAISLLSRTLSSFTKAATHNQGGSNSSFTKESKKFDAYLASPHAP